MSLLTRDLIDGADDLPYEDVPVPEWGGTVRLRTLTGSERDEFEASVVSQNGTNRRVNLKNVRARLVSLCLVDEEGNRLYTNTDVAKLGKKSAKVLDRLFDKAQKLSGLTDDDVEELVEGFGTAPNDEPGSE
jgi:hypothetical protein